MSQDLVTNQTAPDAPQAQPEALSGQPWSAETYADSLMNELFEDVERLAEGGTSLPTEVSQPEPVGVQSLSIPQMILASALAPRQGLSTQPQSTALDTVDPKTDLALAKPTPERSLFDKLVLGLAGASVLLTALIWLSGQGGQRFWGSKTTTTVATAPTQQDLQAQADAQFSQYIQKSLEMIDQLGPTAPKGAIAPTTAPQPPAALPTVPVNGNLAQAPSRLPTALERIYNPIPREPQRLIPRPAVPVPPVSRPPVVTVRPAPLPPVAVAPAPVPVAPVAPVSPAPAPVPAAVHTLQGVIEWGDRSAALFDINGSTQRVNLGEAIGTSGWTLVKVTNSEALIRRNGEVRSIYVGQKF